MPISCMMCGVSGGACIYGALREAERMDEGNIVVMMADGGFKYLPARPWGAVEQRDSTLDDIHWW